MMIFLALVNGIHQWPVIKWILPCSTSSPFIHMVKNYVIFVWEIEDPGMLPIVTFSTQVAMEWLYGHIDPLCNWSWLCLDSVANPLCMSSWLQLVLAFKYRPTLYFSGYTLLIIITMDPHCIGQWPCLCQFLSWAWDMPASVLTLSYIAIGCPFAAPLQFSFRFFQLINR